MTQSDATAPQRKKVSRWDSIEYDMSMVLTDEESTELEALHTALLERAESLPTSSRRDLMWNVRAAYKNKSVDSLRLYAKLPTMFLSSSFVNAGINAAHRLGYKDASEVITLRTVESYKEIHHSIPIEGQQFNNVHSVIWELLLEDVENDQAILHLVRDRKVFKGEQLREQVLEMRKHHSSLVEGAL